MKRLILLSIVLLSFLFGHSQSTLNVSPDTVYLGQNLNILFSGSNLNFQQGSSTCQYVYFEQGSNMAFFPNDDLNVINSNQAFSNFTFQQASSTCGNYNAVLVNYCQGSITSKTFPNALFVKCGSLVAGRNVSVDKEPDFALFPNPVLNNQFTLILNEFSDEQNYTLKVYDVSGRSVLNKTLSEKQTAISTGKVAKGTYFVEIAKGTQKTVKKLIFE